MNPSDTGASEVLANLSIEAVVLVAVVLTVFRLLLLFATRTSPRPGKAPETPGYARGIAEILESLIIAGVLVFLIIRPFFVQAFFIPSESMEDTLMGHDAGDTHTDTVHDHLFVNKLVYRYSEPHEGDIIVFRAPAEADKESIHFGRPPQENILIKRLIGVPNDTIEVKAGAVYRNGIRLNESYIKQYSDGRPSMDPSLESNFDFGVPCGLSAKPTCGKITLKPGQLWVMGDNRNNSNDSRYWGTLQRSRVIGKASLIFWPLNRIRAIH